MRRLLVLRVATAMATAPSHPPASRLRPPSYRVGQGRPLLRLIELLAPQVASTVSGRDEVQYAVRRWWLRRVRLLATVPKKLIVVDLPGADDRPGVPASPAGCRP